MKIVSVNQMRRLDYRTINEAGISGKELMLRAGIGAGEMIIEYLNVIHSAHVKRFVILAGKGNNGGDAYVVAKYLRENTDKEILIYSVCHIDELKGDAKYYAEQLPHDIHVSVKNILKEKYFFYGDIIIDGLLGTGFKGSLHDHYLSWIMLINSLHFPVIALDIPSGLNGDDGTIADEAFLCDLTVTIGMPKSGLFKEKGPICCGRIKNVDIGIPSDYLNNIDTELSFFGTIDAYLLLNRLHMDSNKKSFGSILVIGGSILYPGAPFLAGKSALRTGAGVVTVAVPAASQAFSSGVFSIITRRIKDDETGYFTKSSVPEIMSLTEKADVIIIGPGMSDNESCREVLKEILKCPKPTVIDADALNLIAKDISILPNDKINTVFTPHPGEARRLLKGFDSKIKEDENRICKALALMELLHGTVVYKGNRTITVSLNELPCVNGSGGPALATAGSGDVLTGIIAANIGVGMRIHDAACLGVYLHGVTEEVSDKGSRGLIADDIVDLIPSALKRSSPFA